MDVVTPSNLSVGDIIEGPEGPEMITEFNGRVINFANGKRCMMFFPNQRITRYISAEILKQAGVKV